MRFVGYFFIVLFALAGLAIAGALYLYAAFSIRYPYEVRAKFSVNGTLYEASFLAVCGNTLKGRLGSYRSHIYSFEAATLHPGRPEAAIVVPLYEPCGKANKYKLKLASWLGLGPITLDKTHFALLLTDGTAVLTAPLQAITGRTDSPEPVISQVEMKALGNKHFENRRLRPTQETIMPEETTYTTLLYRVAPKEWSQYFQEEPLVTLSDRYSFFLLRAPRELPERAPRAISFETQVNFAVLTTHSGEILYQADLVPEGITGEKGKDLMSYDGPYSFRGISPMNNTLNLLPGDIRFPSSVEHAGMPIPLKRFARPSSNLLQFAIIDERTDALLLPMLATLRLNYIIGAPTERLEPLTSVTN